MTRLSWGQVGKKYFEAGVDRAVLYVGSSSGVPWEGLTSVDEKPTGGEARAYYIDGVKYLNIATDEEFNASITAFTYPVQFEQCDGTTQLRPGLFLGQQERKPFGLTYRTGIGNDSDGINHGYRIHIVYNALAAPANKTYDSLSDSADPTDFTWDLTTRPPVMTGVKRTSHVVIDSRYTNPITIAAIEDILYGTESTNPRLPTLSELVAVYDALVDLTVVDNGDGTAVISAPDGAIVFFADGEYTITWDSVEMIDEDTYSISS